MTPEEVSNKDVAGKHVAADPLHKGYSHLRDLYFGEDPGYEGRFTVPVLFDGKKQRIVSNESAEIMRMMYEEFDGLVEERFRGVKLLPEGLKGKVEEVNGWTYDEINK